MAYIWGFQGFYFSFEFESDLCGEEEEGWGGAGLSAALTQFLFRRYCKNIDS